MDSPRNSAISRRETKTYDEQQHQHLNCNEFNCSLHTHRSFLVVVRLSVHVNIGLSVDSVCHEHEMMRDANETSGELGSPFGGTLVGLSQLRIP